ncbi:MAG: hypothetical protein J07HX64_00572 [halophilic archaeon J07HX64]|nr:MAG: hypothetical protein J07HX64_00572 [halophilic archaeon J07HX64]
MFGYGFSQNGSTGLGLSTVHGIADAHSWEPSVRETGRRPVRCTDTRWVGRHRPGWTASCVLLCVRESSLGRSLLAILSSGHLVTAVSG